MSRVFNPTNAQLCAKSFKGSDLLVSAGAGSGKTTTLTNRVIERIIKYGEDISRKLVVTFTKESANDLRAKISEKLAAELAKSPQRHISEQIVRLGAADICTIDSFCLKLVRAHFEQLGLDGSFRIADEAEAQLLCTEAMSDVIDESFERRGRSLDTDKMSAEDIDFLRVCDCFSSFSSEEKLKKDLLDLYKKLITTKDSIETLLRSPALDDDFLKTPYGAEIRTLTLEFLNYYEGAFNYIIAETSKNEGDKAVFYKALSSDIDYIAGVRCVILGGGDYEAVRLSLANYPSARRGKLDGATHPDIELFLEIREKFKSKRKEIIKKYFSSSDATIRSSYKKNEGVLHALYEILKAFENEYSRRKKQIGVCDFNDISRYALHLLYDEAGQITPLARDIASQYDEIYVDEYQDTNFVQDKIFLAISNGNRFLVGDIKQSIYRFRSAEPEIFMSYRQGFDTIDVDTLEVDENGELCVPSGENYPNGATIFMSENFRCAKSVIDFSNCVSDFMFTLSDSISYCAADALRFKKAKEGLEDSCVEVYLVDKSTAAAQDENDEGDGEGEESDDEDDEELLRREAELVALKIKSLLHENEGKINPCDIAILLRGFKRPVELYTEALSRHGIKSEYKGDEHFFEKSEILLVMCLLNAIDNPLRDAYLAGAMRSSIFGFSLDDMVKIRAASSSELSIYAALKAYDGGGELGDKVLCFLERLNKYRTLCLRKTAHEAISILYADTGILFHASESERQSLLKLYDIARSYESGKYKGLYGFLRYVESVEDASSKEQLGSQGEDCVKLMSIHASKGLEFEICFVCGCGSKLNVKDSSDPILYHRDLGVCAYVSRDRGVAKFNTVLRRAASAAIKRASIAEEMRMLYVAMTRAASKLILTAGVKNPEAYLDKCTKKSAFASAYSALNPTSYMDWVLGALARAPELAKVSIVYPHDLDKMSDEQSSFGAPAVKSNEPSEEQIIAELKRRFEFEYSHSSLEKIPSKVSISRLSPEVFEGDENTEVKPKYSLDSIPDFVSESQGTPSGAQRGTATHLFFQFCDYNALFSTSAEAELERLVSLGFISKRDSELVSISHIRRFKESELLSMLRGAKNVWRELRFNIMLPVSMVTPEVAFEGKEVLVQGVTDCVAELPNGDLILIDYKTDFVTRENCEQYLKDKYAPQLRYYKYAIEKIFSRPLSRVIIYSVALNKIIDL